MAAVEAQTDRHDGVQWVTKPQHAALTGIVQLQDLPLHHHHTSCCDYVTAIAATAKGQAPAQLLLPLCCSCCYCCLVVVLFAVLIKVRHLLLVLNHVHIPFADFVAGAVRFDDELCQFVDKLALHVYLLCACGVLCD